MCLTELANVRHSIFNNVEARVEFVKNFATHAINLFQSSAKMHYILKDRIIYKEVVKMLHKFEVRFSFFNDFSLTFR